jgi:hypothetical protein
MAPGSTALVVLSGEREAWTPWRRRLSANGDGWIPFVQPKSRWIKEGRWPTLLRRDGISGSFLVGGESKGDSFRHVLWRWGRR